MLSREFIKVVGVQRGGGGDGCNLNEYPLFRCLALLIVFVLPNNALRDISIEEGWMNPSSIYGY